jgi:hypothetical protein
MPDSHLRQKESGSQEEHQRHIILEGQSNFHDLGGYQTMDGRDEIIKAYGSFDGFTREGLALSQQDNIRLRDELLE